MKRILSLALLVLLFANCKENTQSNSTDLDNLNTEVIKDSSNKTVEDTRVVMPNNNDNNSVDWTFYKIPNLQFQELQKKQKLK